LSETEQERKDRESGKDDLAAEGGFCCLLSLLNASALLLAPVLALLMLNR
jgi:hypothetical protein